MEDNYSVLNDPDLPEEAKIALLYFVLVELPKHSLFHLEDVKTSTNNLLKDSSKFEFSNLSPQNRMSGLG
jgi:hypothetical protein